MKTSSIWSRLFGRRKSPVPTAWSVRHRYAPPQFRLGLESLDDRVAPAVVTFTGGVLGVSLNTTSETVTITNNGSTVAVTSSHAINGQSSFPVASVKGIAVSDSANLVGQLVRFEGSPFSLANGLICTGVEVVLFNAAVTALKSSSITVTAPGFITVNANLTGGTGGTSLTGLGQAVSSSNGIVGVSIQNATVSANGPVSVMGTGGAGLTKNFGVSVTLGGVVTALGNAPVVIQGQGGTGERENYGVFLSDNGSRITSGGGNVSVNGTGGNNIGSNGVCVTYESTITAGGTGSVTVQGLGGGTYGGVGTDGVEVLGQNAQITSGGGNVIVTGTGGGENSNGVTVFLAGTITAGGSGSVTVVGYGGRPGNLAHGVQIGFPTLNTNLGTSRITSGGGNVSVTGFGGGNASNGGSNGNSGVSINADGVITAGGVGSVTVRGTGGPDNFGDQVGVDVHGSITSGGGHVLVSGTGGKGGVGGNYGVLMMGGSISAVGMGKVVVEGFAGEGTIPDGNPENIPGTPQSGVSLFAALVLDSYGFVDVRSSVIASSGGNISIIGSGAGGSNGGSPGVEFIGGIVQAGGLGSVNIRGNGAIQSNQTNVGVSIYSVLDVTTSIKTSGGDITIIGIGGGKGLSEENAGILISSSLNDTPVIISAEESGQINFQGTGGVGARSHGVAVANDSQVVTGLGTLAISGTANSGSQSHGVALFSENEGTVKVASQGGVIRFTGSSTSGPAITIDKAAVTSGSSLLLASTIGDIMFGAGGTVSAASTVRLQSAGAVTAADSSLRVTANALSATANLGIGTSNTALGTKVNLLAASSTTGSISLSNTAAALSTASLTAFNTTLSGISVTKSGDIAIRSSGPIALNRPISSPGTVSLTALAGGITGSTSGSTSLSATSAVLTAATGVGTSETGLETSISKLEAILSGAGGIYLFNSRPLTIGGVVDVAGVQTQSGDIQIVTNGSLTVGEDIRANAAGSIKLTVSDAASAGNDLTILNGVTVRAVSGAMTLNAGDTVRLNAGSTLQSTTGLTLNIGDNDAGDGGSGVLVGALLSNSVVQVNGGSGADTFTPTTIPAAGMTFIGGAGRDTLDLSPYSPTTGTTVTLTGTDTGTVASGSAFQFAAVENVTGGLGDDRFVLTATGRLSGSIDGGTGVNTLDATAVPGNVLHLVTGVNQGDLVVVGGSSPNPLLLNSSGLAARGYSNIGSVRTNTVSPFVVDVSSDLDDNNFSVGNLSLREAVRLANGYPGANTIGFAGTLVSPTITLGSPITLTDTSGATQIGNTASGRPTISGGGLTQIFRVNSGVTAELIGLKFDAGKIMSGLGGAINNHGNLTLRNGIFTNNAAGQGGAIQSTGSLIVDSCTFDKNSSADNGGAMSLFGPTTITNSTFTGNTVVNQGGALISDGPLTIANSTFADNGRDAVLLRDGTADLRNVTIAINRDGGLRLNTATATLRNSLVAGNTNFDLVGSLANGSSNNLLNMTAAAAGIGPLGDHGGPTQTITLLPGSPAVNAGSNDAASALATDQRGQSRIAAGVVDIGAFEVQVSAPRVTSFQVLYGNGRSFELFGATRTYLPWAITGIRVTFDQVVNGTSNSLSGFSVGSFAGNGTATLTWTLTSPVLLSTANIQLAATGSHAIRNAYGVALDGTNAGGAGGTAFLQSIRILAGDFDDDGVVTINDAIKVRNLIGSANSFADTNGDGTVNMDDVQFVRSRIGSRAI